MSRSDGQAIYFSRFLAADLPANNTENNAILSSSNALVPHVCRCEEAITPHLHLENCFRDASCSGGALQRLYIFYSGSALQQVLSDRSIQFHFVAPFHLCFHNSKSYVLFTKQHIFSPALKTLIEPDTELHHTTLMSNLNEKAQVEYEHHEDHDIQVRKGSTHATNQTRAYPMVDGHQQGGERRQGHQGQRSLQ